MMQIFNEIVDDLFEDLGDGGKSATKNDEEHFEFQREDESNKKRGT